MLSDGGKNFRVESEFTIRTVGDQDTYADLAKVCGSAQGASADYYAKLKSGENFYQGHLKELIQKYPPLPNKPCDGSNSKPVATSSSRRRASSARSHSKHHHNNHRGHDNHQRQHDRVYQDSNHRCAPPEHLIIDAMYVPMPIVGDNTANAPGYSTGPSLWLTSSSAPLPFKTVFATFDKQQIETIVQHLDPVLQNSYMQKITSLLPSDITYAFRMFDAINYPDVISLRDMEYPHWGEQCAAKINT
eukprot:gene8430-10009_t